MGENERHKNRERLFDRRANELALYLTDTFSAMVCRKLPGWPLYKFQIRNSVQLI